jgi:hypothetical protein
MAIIRSAFVVRQFQQKSCQLWHRQGANLIVGRFGLERLPVLGKSQELFLLTFFLRCYMRQGIPYQTLMASILHRYIHGSLTDKAQA